MVRLREMRRRVQLIQPGEYRDGAREVSSEEFDRIVDMHGQATQSQAQGYIVIYDQLTGAPRSISHNVAVQHDLRKVVSYCTACKQTAATSAEVNVHIANVAKKAQSHRDARSMDMVTAQGAGNRCSACDATFVSRPSAVHEHIREAVTAGGTHVHAEVRSIQQFGMEPPVVVPEYKNGATPVASQEGWRPRRRRRHRNRGHKEVRA